MPWDKIQVLFETVVKFTTAFSGMFGYINEHDKKVISDIIDGANEYNTGNYNRLLTKIYNFSYGTYTCKGVPTSVSWCRQGSMNGMNVLRIILCKDSMTNSGLLLIGLDRGLGKYAYVA